MSHSLVTDCAVIGVYAQKEACRVITGFVTLTGSNGKDLEEVKNEILEITKTQLAPEKQLHGGLYILEDFPRTSTGKINRSELLNYPMYQRVMSLEIKS
jgi:acyl-coenzyme A synthetase/AMP-(fatty) acid ligase